jgi:tetratricopeptide (TPR) repeat protein
MVLASAPVAAQERWQPGPPPDPYRQAQPAPPPPSGSSDLRRNLATVGSDPNNVSALVDSGRAALAMGDAQAALTFFSRADEVAPRDARIKAGMASAMTMLGQPRAALTLFAEAQGLGAPELEIAADRGLAHDLLGDPRAAQRDYALVLRRRDHDETRRRLALSLAISGQREPALRLLEPQIRRNDRAGWRTQAFVLALTGDTAGATRVAAGTGPVGTAEAMAPFLGRLPALSPAQRAMAVHLGVFPSDGRTQYAANIDTTPDPGALALAGGPARPTPAVGAATETRRDERPGLRRQQRPRSPIERAAVAPPPERRQVAAAQPQPQRLRPYVVPGPSGEVRVPTRVARPEPGPQARPDRASPAAQPAPDNARFAPPRSEQEPVSPAAPPPSVAQAMPPPTPPPAASAGVDPAILAGMRPGDTIAAPGFSLTPGPVPVPPPAGAPAPSGQREAALGDIAMVVSELRDQGAVAPSAQLQSQPAPPPSAPAPAQARHWVQVAGNINPASMAGEFRRLRGRAPALLNGMQPWAARVAGSGRLLVGPFGSPRDAQSFVNQLRPNGIEAVTWSSAAGQAIDRVSVPGGPAPAARAARAAPDRATASTATRGRGEQPRATASSRSARGREEETRAAARSPNARGRGEEARASGSRNARGRTETARTGASARDARGTARTTGNAREARTTARETRATGRSAAGRETRAAAANSRSNRTTSTVERRANGNDARPTRGRSAPEPRSSSRGRRAN